jgi:hypothetical protein
MQRAERNCNSTLIVATIIVVGRKLFQSLASSDRIEMKLLTAECVTLCRKIFCEWRVA